MSMTDTIQGTTPPTTVSRSTPAPTLTKAASRKLNKAIAELCDDESLPEVVGLAGTGKPIPYIGWYWRDVDFTQPISLGRCRTEPSIMVQLYGRPDLYKHAPSWAGFMENNKWDYPEWTLTPEQGTALIGLLQVAVKEPTQRNLQAVFDHCQSTIPDSVREWSGRTGWDDLREKYPELAR